MTPMDPKDDKALQDFLRAHNPVAPRAPADELAQLQGRLRKPWHFTGWLPWAPAFGAAAALVVWLAVQKGPTPSKEDEWWIDTAEAQSLIDEEPAAEWASLITSVE